MGFWFYNFCVKWSSLDKRIYFILSYLFSLSKLARKSISLQKVIELAVNIIKHNRVASIAKQIKPAVMLAFNVGVGLYPGWFISNPAPCWLLGKVEEHGPSVWVSNTHGVTQRRLPVSSFGLTQPLPLEPFVEWTSRCNTSISPTFSVIFTLKYMIFRNLTVPGVWYRA